MRLSRSDSFSFKANDGALDSNIATENLTVNFVNQPPVAQAGSAIGNENATITGSLAASDVDGSRDLQCGHPGGARQRDGHADGTFSYTPTPTTRRRQLHLQGHDGTLDSNVATENLTVNFVNQARWRKPTARAAMRMPLSPARSPRAMSTARVLTYSAVGQAAHGR